MNNLGRVWHSSLWYNLLEQMALISLSNRFLTIQISKFFRILTKFGGISDVVSCWGAPLDPPHGKKTAGGSRQNVRNLFDGDIKYSNNPLWRYRTQIAHAWLHFSRNFKSARTLLNLCFLLLRWKNHLSTKNGFAHFKTCGTLSEFDIGAAICFNARFLWISQDKPIYTPVQN